MAHIVTHPDNVELLRKKLNEGQDAARIPRLEIRSKPHMERDKPAGKYRVHATGKVLAKDEFRLCEGRFIEYGPDDIPYLLMRGVIEELREPLFIQISDAMEAFQIRARFAVGITPSYRTAYFGSTFA